MVIYSNFSSFVMFTGKSSDLPLKVLTVLIINNITRSFMLGKDNVNIFLYYFTILYSIVYSTEASGDIIYN